MNFRDFRVIIYSIRVLRFYGPKMIQSGEFKGPKVDPQIRNEEYEFPLAPMGVLAPCMRTLDRSARPPATQAEIFRCTRLQSHL